MSTDGGKQLRHVFSVMSGATPSSGNDEYWDGAILWITPEDLNDRQSYWIEDTRRKITDAGYDASGTSMAPAYSIVLSKRAPIGHVAVLREPACSNQGCLLLVPRIEADSRYFYYWLSCQTEYLQALGRGSTFMELSADDLKSIRVPDFPPSQQRTIADYLDRETVRLDTLVAAKERVLRLLSEKRQALIVRAVTRGIDPNVSYRDSGIPWLGDIPEHWAVCMIARLFREYDERCRPDLPLLEVSIDRGVVIREFSSDRIESTAADFNTYKVARQGDIVFNKMRMWQGAVGTALEDGLVSPDYVVARPTSCLSSAYASLLFRTPVFSAESARKSHGIVWDRLRLYWQGFRDIAVPVPPALEQLEIVERVQQEKRTLDELSTATSQTIALLQERRAALIAAAVIGRIDVERAA